MTVRGTKKEAQAELIRLGQPVRDKKLPRVMFHASARARLGLIAGGIDIVTISRRLGHCSPAIMLLVYAHLFNNTDAAAAIEAALRPRG